jgi:4-diphosphocytidyl-2-C-methyl-D-erythritol kinase
LSALSLDGADGWLSEPAPAKINLYLHVLGRRDDGYHRLDSLVVFAGVHDTLSARVADSIRLDISGPFAPALEGADDDNLMVQAARGLAEIAGRAAGVHLRLVKRLPVAAGIGGGSADAAAALRLLCRLWKVTPEPENLEALALSLGADVPVCLDGRALFVGGIGEELCPSPCLPSVWLVLVNPGVPLATGGVFSARRGPGSVPGRFEEPPADAAALSALLSERSNDLEAPALELEPVVGQTLDALAALPGCRLARMSGSGATCFGLFADQRAARNGVAAIAAANPRWWSVAAPLVQSRAQAQAAALNAEA